MSLNDHFKYVPTRSLSVLLLLLLATSIPASGPGVHGRVMGHDQNGKYLGIVPSAHIEFHAGDGGLAAQADSDKNGYFKVDLPPGDYLYKVQATGYLTEDSGRGLRLSQSEGYAVFNLAMTKGQDAANRKPFEKTPKPVARLKGRVFEKTTDGSSGVGAAHIALRREGSTELRIVQSHASADDEHQIGDYALGLEAGTYHASVRADGFELFVEPAAITIAAGEESKHDFLLKRKSVESSKGQGIQGVVTIIDSDTTPPPINIQIVSLNATARPIDVKQGGNISFKQDLPPGQYRVLASAVGFPNTESPPVYVLQGRYTRVNLALRARSIPEPKTVVELFVFEKKPGSDAVTPLAGAKVSLSKSGLDPSRTIDGTTDKTGHAYFPVEEAGEYLAEAHLTGYRAGTGHGNVLLGQTHEVGIELVKDSVRETELSLVAVVTDAATLRPLSGVRLLARQAGQSISDAARAISDSQGQATLKVKRSGAYTVLAQLNGYGPGGGELDVMANRSNRITIALKPLATRHEPDGVNKALIKGYVAYREPTGQLRSVGGANLIWKLQPPAHTSSAQFVTTGNDGKYQVELVPGSYEVQVKSPPGFEHITEFVEVRPGQQDKYFIVSRTERVVPDQPVPLIDVAGQVVTETRPRGSKSIANAELLFVRGNDSIKSMTNQDGRFSLRLSAGQYQVHVRAAGFDPLNTHLDVHQGLTPTRLVLMRSAAPDTDPATSTTLNITTVEGRRGLTDKLMPPLPGAQVSVMQQGRVLFAGQTNALGRYSVRVQPGQYSLTVAKPGYANVTSDVNVAGRELNHQIVMIPSSNSGPDANRKLTLTVHVSRRAGQPTAAIKPLGNPVPAAQVTVMRGSQVVATGQTNATGAYSVQLLPGNYAVKVSAAGQAPAGKTVMLNTENVDVNFQLEGIPSSATTDEVNSSATRFSRGAADLTQLGQLTTVYVVEHRNNARSPWIELGQYSSQREAQAALFRAVEHGQIPGGAPAESRIRTVTRLRSQPGRN